MEYATYTTVSGDTLQTAAAGLNNAINSDINLDAIDLEATVSGAVVTLKLIGDLGSQANISAYAVAPSQVATIGGTFTTGDTAGVRFTNANLVGSPLTISHTVVSGDTNDSCIATALKIGIDANTALAALGISATVAGAAITISVPSNIGAVTIAGVNGTAQTVTMTGAQTESATVAQLSGQSGPIIPQSDFNFVYNSALTLYRANQPYLVSPDLLAAMVAAGCPIK